MLFSINIKKTTSTYLSTYTAGIKLTEKFNFQDKRKD